MILFSDTLIKDVRASWKVLLNVLIPWIDNYLMVTRGSRLVVYPMPLRSIHTGILVQSWKKMDVKMMMMMIGLINCWRNHYFHAFQKLSDITFLSLARQCSENVVPCAHCYEAPKELLRYGLRQKLPSFRSLVDDLLWMQQVGAAKGKHSFYLTDLTNSQNGSQWMPGMVPMNTRVCSRFLNQVCMLFSAIHSNTLSCPVVKWLLC